MSATLQRTAWFIRTAIQDLGTRRKCLSDQSITQIYRPAHNLFRLRQFFGVAALSQLCNASSVEVMMIFLTAFREHTQLVCYLALPVPQLSTSMPHPVHAACRMPAGVAGRPRPCTPQCGPALNACGHVSGIYNMACSGRCAGESRA